NNFNYDLVIAYYLINTNRSNYLLNNLLFDLFNKNIKEDNGTQISFFEQTDDTIDNENINLILKGIYLSYDIMYNKLKSYDMLQLFNEIEMPLIETLASMEHTGMYIDINKLNDFDIEVTEKLVNLEDTIHKITNSNFNINSPKQLGELLFEVLQLPIIKKNKNGYSTDKDVLELLKDKHEVIPYILEYRTLIKLKSTYIDGLKNKIKNNRIHTTFMQTVAETGRLSSTDPNLQNIPVRLELGSRIRSFFVAQNNYKIMDADYSQIELRILSHMSDDINLKKAFIDNIDVHTLTASEIFNVDIKDVTKEMRSKAKAINFGIVYGISDYGLAKNIDSSVSDANKYITNYLEKYSNVKVFMDKLITDARINRYVTTMFNRRRYVDEINNSNKNISKSSERISMNAPIQGTAADIIKLAMNDIYTKLKNYKSKLIMQVHDELIIEVENSEIDEIKEIMKNSMENIVKLSIPLTVDLNIGESWYDAK
ncbi:MAG: DNA polymerase, partial [Clostridia bacterium]